MPAMIFLHKFFWKHFNFFVTHRFFLFCTITTPQLGNLQTTSQAKMAAKMLTSLLRPPSFGFKVQTTNFFFLSRSWTRSFLCNADSPSTPKPSKPNYTKFTKNSQKLSQKQPTIENSEKTRSL